MPEFNEQVNFFNQPVGNAIKGVADVEPLTEKVVDGNGNEYDWVPAAGKFWMVQNLRATKFMDGTDLTFFSGNSFDGSSGPSYNFPANDPLLPV
jgi:hypothetical protein